MKKYLIILGLLIRISGSEAKVPDAPSGLMVEFIRYPSGVLIMDLKPEFSWVVPASAKTQTAWEIIVSSSKENIEKSIGDIWDSKKVIDKNSTEIEFNSGTLKSNSTYFWRVRIWGENGKPTEYSDFQQFKTGNTYNYNTTQDKFQFTTVDPVKFVKISPGHFFYDFGKDAFGTLVLEINSDSESTITIHLGEKLKRKNEIDRKPQGSIRYQSVKLNLKPGQRKYTLDLPKDERNTGPNAIQLPDSLGVVTPFRYCEIENCYSELTAKNIGQKRLSTFFVDNSSSFTCSDTVLNKIWNICKYSIKATSFAGKYVDGDRERIPYEADAYINQLGHYYADREYSIARLTNEYFINHPTWPTEWILQTVSMFYNDFMYTGNSESISKFYAELKNKTLTKLAREDGLISSKKCTDEILKSIGFADAKTPLKDIVDWPPSQKDTGWKLATPEGERDGYDMVEINTVVNAFYYHGLKCMEKIAGTLGNNEDSILYHKSASKVKESFNQALLNKTTGIYLDGEGSTHSSLHANMMALAFDLVPDANKSRVINFIKSRGMACSVYGAQYLLEGLYRAGEGDYAFSLLTATNDRSWWNMIRSGSTITMEAWDMKYKPNSDWNHAWGAAPVNIIPGYMWGIVPAAAGYRKAIIKPQLSSLKNSKISVPTIRGNIIAEYNNGKFSEYTIIIPANMDCDFVIPEKAGKLISFNNKKVENGNRILKLKPGLNKIIFNK